MRELFLNLCRLNGVSGFADAVRDAIRAEALPYADRMQVALSGDCWVDVMNKSVSKGAALQELLRRMDIAPEHCMAFGDYLNDIELLQASGHPYAMENAHPQLLELFPNTSGHNNHGGVVTTICRELGIEV